MNYLYEIYKRYIRKGDYFTPQAVLDEIERIEEAEKPKHPFDIAVANPPFELTEY